MKEERLGEIERSAGSRVGRWDAHAAAKTPARQGWVDVWVGWVFNKMMCMRSKGEGMDAYE